jgi:H+/gluconate symporter-like permease
MQYFYVFALSHIRRLATSSSYFIEKIRSRYSWQGHKNIVLFIAISIAFTGYIMKEYTVEYQTDQEAVAEMHRTSNTMLLSIAGFGFVIYFFNQWWL